jgi:TPR repeat protein
MFLSKKVSSELSWALKFIEDGNSKITKDQAKGVFLGLLNANVDKRVLHNLAFCYSEGIGTKKDFKKAFRLYNLAAKAGSLGAFFNIANMYEKGQGVKGNKKKAFEYYKKGAFIGDVWSHLNVGWYYYNGVGTSLNLELAEFHWKIAARKKIPSALYSLGILYSENQVDLKNIKLAVKFFKAAKGLGHLKSKAALIKAQKVLDRFNKGQK